MMIIIIRIVVVILNLNDNYNGNGDITGKTIWIISFPTHSGPRASIPYKCDRLVSLSNVWDALAYQTYDEFDVRSFFVKKNFQVRSSTMENSSQGSWLRALQILS